MLINKRKNQSRVNQVVLAFKKERIRKNVSRYKLAQATGLSESSIAKIKEEKTIIKKTPDFSGVFPVNTVQGYGLDITFILTVPSLLMPPSASEAFTVWRSVYH